MDRVHSQCLTDGQEDRGKDQACRCHIHKSTYDQQQDVDNEQDHVTAYKDNRRNREYLLCGKRTIGKYSGGYGKVYF